MTDKNTRQLVEEYIRLRLPCRTEGELYVSLALEIYQRGCDNPDNDVLTALERYQDNSGFIIPEPDIKYLVSNRKEAIDFICDSQQHPLLAEHWLYMTPKSISRLCVDLAKVTEGDRVYLPFLGLGGFTDFLPESCTIEGEEYDRTVWALGRIRQWSKGIVHTGLICGDSYRRMQDPDNNGRYDTVIMAPPYGFNNWSKWGDDIAESLDKSLSVLNGNGRIVMFAPEYFNINAKFTGLRERLLQEGLVETVITLREGLLLPATGISSCIWVVSKTRNEDVTFIDASGCLLPRNGQAFRSLNPEAVLAISASEYSEAKSVVASGTVDPKYVMPDRSRMAYSHGSTSVHVQVLWLDDDPTVVDALRVMAREKGVELTHFESWDECEDVFRQNILKWDAVILDANCKFHANETVYNVNTFLCAAVSRIERICYQSKVDTIPWYVLTEGSGETPAILEDCLRNMDRPWENGAVSKSFYLKGENMKERGLLLDRIIAQRNRSVQYKVEVKFHSVFEAISSCGLDESVRKYMLDLLCPMYDGTSPTDYNHRFNDARKTLEAIFSDMIRRGFLPESLRTSDKKGANLSWCSLILAGEEEEINNVPRLRGKGLSRYNCRGYAAYTKLMAYNVKSIIFAAGSNEHDQQVLSDDGRRTVNTDLYLSDVNRSSYLIQSYALQLCDIILWYQDFLSQIQMTNGNKEK